MKPYPRWVVVVLLVGCAGLAIVPMVLSTQPLVDDFTGNGPPLGRLCVLEQLEPGMRFELPHSRGEEWLVCQPVGWWPDKGFYRGGWLEPGKPWGVPMVLAVRVSDGEAWLWSWGWEVRRVK